MRKRRWFLSAALILCLTGAAWLFFWPRHDLAQTCFDRISVGMPYLEAKKTLQENGFVLGGGGVNHSEATMVFKRAGTRAIIICVPITGEVSSKELGDFTARGNFLLDLWHWVIGEK